jgi:hypothetical protein
MAATVHQTQWPRRTHRIAIHDGLPFSMSCHSGWFAIETGWSAVMCHHSAHRISNRIGKLLLELGSEKEGRLH